MKFIVYLLFPLCILSCRNNNEAEAIMNTAKSLMTDDPAKAKLLLEAIDEVDLNNLSFRAKYALLYSQVLDKNYIDKTNDSLISIAVDYYDRKGSDEVKALAHYYHGRIYENGNDLENAIKSYVLAENAASNTRNFHSMGFIKFSIGNLYAAQYSFLEAINYFQQAADAFKKAGDRYNEAIVLTNMGRTFMLKSENGKAQEKYKEAIEIYKEIGKSNEIQNLYELLAVVRLDRGDDIDSVKGMLHHSYAETNEGRIPISSMGLWQHIYIKEKNLDSARICSKIILDNSGLFSSTQITGCLAEMSHIEQIAGNYKKAYQYRLQYGEMMDSIHLATRSNLIQEIERKYKNQILKETNQNLRIRQRYQNIIIVLLFFTLAIGSILITLILIQWRKKAKAEIKRANAEIKRLSTTYRELQTQYDVVRNKINSNDEQEMRVVKAIEERLNGLRDLVETTQSIKSATFVKQFHKYMKVNVRSSISLSDLQYVVNKKFHGIIDYLKENYPLLTKQDLDLCCLLCFGFSQYGICYLYETEIQTFYNKRHRLRERLGLKQNQKIEIFIRDLITMLDPE